MWLQFSMAFLLLVCVPHLTTASLLPRQLNSLIKSAQGIFHPAGGSRGKAAAVAKKSTVSTAGTTAAPLAALATVSSNPAPQFDVAALLAQMSQNTGQLKTQSFNPADLLGQLSITFDKSNKNSIQTESGDVVAQVSAMLPMILSIAKPVMNSYKGTDGYGGLMDFLHEAKELLSNRDVVRQLNQFLDDLIVGGASDGQNQTTPPTPSDSSLNSLAQIAQNMETMFNVPQARPKKIHTYGRLKITTTDSSNVNDIPGDETDGSSQAQSDDSRI